MIYKNCFCIFMTGKAKKVISKTIFQPEKSALWRRFMYFKRPTNIFIQKKCTFGEAMKVFAIRLKKFIKLLSANYFYGLTIWQWQTKFKNIFCLSFFPRYFLRWLLYLIQLFIFLAMIHYKSKNSKQNFIFSPRPTNVSITNSSHQQKWVA